jgi:hypothetical protein
MRRSPNNFSTRRSRLKIGHPLAQCGHLLQEVRQPTQRGDLLFGLLEGSCRGSHNNFPIPEVLSRGNPGLRANDHAIADRHVVGDTYLARQGASLSHSGTSADTD